MTLWQAGNSKYNHIINVTIEWKWMFAPKSFNSTLFYLNSINTEGLHEGILKDYVFHRCFWTWVCKGESKVSCSRRHRVHDKSCNLTFGNVYWTRIIIYFSGHMTWHFIKAHSPVLTQLTIYGGVGVAVSIAVEAGVRELVFVIWEEEPGLAGLAEVNIGEDAIIWVKEAVGRALLK